VAIRFSKSLPVLSVAGKFMNLVSVFLSVKILFHLLSSTWLLSVVCVCVCALEKS